jgi:hypothetical protein
MWLTMSVSPISRLLKSAMLIGAMAAVVLTTVAGAATLGAGAIVGVAGAKTTGTCTAAGAFMVGTGFGDTGVIGTIFSQRRKVS